MIEGREYACPRCGCTEHTYLEDDDNGDWTEASYKCNGCGKIEYVELAD